MSRTASYNGYEVAIYPLDNVGITADPWAANHVVTGVSNTGLWDNGWHNQTNDPLYAPFTMEYIAYGSSGHTQMFQSVNPVWIPGYGTPQYVTFSVSHSNTLYYSIIGDVIPQGAHFYDTGDYGLGSGPHVHFILYVGQRNTIWPVGSNPNGYGNIWYSPNPPDDIADMFYLLNDQTISAGWGLDWQYWSGSPTPDSSLLVTMLMMMRKRKQKGEIIWL